MRRRSSAAGTLGLVALVASWAFGSTPLGVVGTGFVLAGLLARGWVRLAGGAIDAERHLMPGERVEGADLVVEIRARCKRRILSGSITVCQRLGETEHEVRIRGSRAEIVFARLPRGRHELGPLEVTVTDPLGLERVLRRVDGSVAVLVRPRIPVLTSVFSTNGARETGAARSRFRRPTGFEIHAVRDYAPGEPLRAVHWPTTARRGRMMVKELDDAPRDHLAIVLDLDADGVAGPPGASSFDAAVRVAGALALAHVRSGRTVVVVGTAPFAESTRIRTLGHDWQLALDALAVVEPVVGARVDRALRDPPQAISRATEIVVVTGRPGLAIAPLLDVRRGGRAVSLVALASETFAGRLLGAGSRELLLATARGIPIAVVSAGVSIEDALGGGLAGVRHG